MPRWRSIRRSTAQYPPGTATSPFGSAQPYATHQAPVWNNPAVEKAQGLFPRLFGPNPRYKMPTLPVYMAAPWYNYWPYDGHFLTAAPMAGAGMALPPQPGAGYGYAGAYFAPVGAGYGPGGGYAAPAPYGYPAPRDPVGDFALPKTYVPKTTDPLEPKTPGEPKVDLPPVPKVDLPPVPPVPKVDLPPVPKVDLPPVPKVEVTPVPKADAVSPKGIDLLLPPETPDFSPVALPKSAAGPSLFPPSR